MSTARPAIRPSLTILRMTPAALRALPCPTIPCEFPLGSRVAGSSPSPRMWECEPMRSTFVCSLSVVVAI